MKTTPLFLAFVLCLAAIISASAQDIPDGFAFDQNVPYGSESERQRFDILYPKEAETGRPLIVYIHGGGWYTGGKGGNKTFTMMRRFTEAGYVAASIEYRLSDEAPFPAAVLDCKQAIRWFRARADQYNIDPNRIGVIGLSAGAHLSAMLALTGPEDGFDGSAGADACAVQASVPVAAPFDLQVPLATKLAHDDDPAVKRFMGGPLTEHTAEARRASPVTYAREDSQSMLIVHGTADNRVNYSQAEAMMDALRNVGAPYELMRVEGVGHSSELLNDPKRFDQILWYFARHLDNVEGYWPYRAANDDPTFEKRAPSIAGERPVRVSE